MSKLKFQNISEKKTFYTTLYNDLDRYSFNLIIKNISGEIEINKKTLIVVLGDPIRSRALVRLLANVFTSLNEFIGRITVDDKELTNENFYSKKSYGFLIKHKYYHIENRIGNMWYSTPLTKESFGLRENLTIKEYVSFLLKMGVLKDEEKVYNILEEYEINLELSYKISDLSYLEQYMLNNLLGLLQDKDFFFTEANDNEQKKILYNLIKKTGYNKTLVCVQNEFEKTDEKTDENIFDNLIYIDEYEKVGTADFSDKVGLAKFYEKEVDLKEFDNKNKKISNLYKKIETEFPNKETKISDILTLFNYERFSFSRFFITLFFFFLIMKLLIFFFFLIIASIYNMPNLNIKTIIYLFLKIVFVIHIYIIYNEQYNLPTNFMTYFKELSEGYYSFYSYRVVKTLYTIFCSSIIYLLFLVLIFSLFFQENILFYIEYLILDFISLLIFSYNTLFLFNSIYDKNYYYILLAIYYWINFGFFPLLGKVALILNNQSICKIQENLYYKFLEVFLNPLIGIEHLKQIVFFNDMEENIKDISKENENYNNFFILNLFENKIILLIITTILGLIANFYIFHRIFKSRRFN